MTVNFMRLCETPKYFNANVAATETLDQPLGLFAWESCVCSGHTVH